LITSNTSGPDRREAFSWSRGGVSSIRSPRVRFLRTRWDRPEGGASPR